MKKNFKEWWEKHYKKILLFVFLFFISLVFLLVAGTLIKVLPCYHYNSYDLSDARWIKCPLHGIMVQGIAGSPYVNIPFNNPLLWRFYVIFYNIIFPVIISFLVTFIINKKKNK